MNSLICICAMAITALELAGQIPSSATDQARMHDLESLGC